MLCKVDSYTAGICQAEYGFLDLLNSFDIFDFFD
jgi:hypothetical protein